MIERFGGLEIQRFGGLRRVNLRLSKPLCQIVSNLQTLVSRYMDHRGYRYIEVCYISFQYPALLAGRGGDLSNLISNKPSYREYAGYMGHGGLMV
jgi:hypothetical protein